MINVTKLFKTIDELKNAERVTKQSLSALSRDLLEYLVETQDVRPITYLLRTDVLTPLNFRIACQYFVHFLPFKSNYAEVKTYCLTGSGERKPLVFNSKNKKTWDKKTSEITTWLEDSANDLWLWADTNVTTEVKEKNWFTATLNALNNGASKGGLSSKDMFEILSQSEVDLMEIISLIDMSEPKVSKEKETVTHEMH